MNCKVCNIEFSLITNKKYCSSNCRRLASNEKLREKEAKLRTFPIKVCVNCNNNYINNIVTSKTCSDICSKKCPKKSNTPKITNIIDNSILQFFNIPTLYL